MARSRRRRLDPGERRRETIPQLPWQEVINPFPPVELLNEGQLAAIHETSVRILEELGIELMSAAARSVLKEKGAAVDEATGVVRLDRGLLDTLISTAPPVVTLTPRDPAHQVKIGGRHLIFTQVAGPPNVHDGRRGRRSGSFSDYCELISLAQSFNAVHMLGNQVVAPIDLPANTRHLDTYAANIRWTTKAFHLSAIGRGRTLDGINLAAIARGEPVEALVERPAVITVISVNSPRRFDEAMADGLMTMAEYGQPVTITPFTLMGAMTPVTLAAALAQQNAEALFGVALAQAVRPGAPVVYGAFTSNVDMRTGAPAFGTPENAQANLAAGQLARRYGLPYRSSNANASTTADAQSVYETMMSLWGAVAGGVNIVYHAAGWLEGGLVASYEKFMIDVEILQHVIGMMQPVLVDDASLAFEAIRDVPTGGHFFGSEHTLERYESAFYRPFLSDWRNYETWADAGAVDATARATSLWEQALAEYQQPPLDPAIDEAMTAYIAKRTEEIGDDEP